MTLVLDRSPSRCRPTRSPTEPPDTTLTVGPPPLTVNFIHIVEFTGTDDWTLPLDLEFECLLDGVLLGTCSTPDEIEALTAGSRASDGSADAICPPAGECASVRTSGPPPHAPTRRSAAARRDSHRDHWNPA